MSWEISEGYDKLQQAKRRRVVSLLNSWDCGSARQFPHRPYSRIRSLLTPAAGAREALKLAPSAITRYVDFDDMPIKLVGPIKETSGLIQAVLSIPDLESPLSELPVEHIDFLLLAQDTVLTGIVGCTHSSVTREPAPRDNITITCDGCGAAAVGKKP